jgi:hypothetical protein
LLNTALQAMTDHAHSIGLKMGWYGNNCGCNEHQNVPSWGANQTEGKADGLHHYEGDIQATIDFGFDGIKVRSSTTPPYAQKVPHTEQ